MTPRHLNYLKTIAAPPNSEQQRLMRDIEALVRQQIEKPRVFVGAIPKRADDDPQVLEAVVIERLNLERDGPASPWWLPADPAPIQCATVADAFREYADLVDREDAGYRAEINSLRQQIEKSGGRE